MCSSSCLSLTSALLQVYATMPTVAAVSLSSLGEPLFLVQLTKARSKDGMPKLLTDGVLNDRGITSIGQTQEKGSAQYLIYVEKGHCNNAK